MFGPASGVDLVCDPANKGKMGRVCGGENISFPVVELGFTFIVGGTGEFFSGVNGISFS
jgi:hypothetical protein